MRFEQAVELLAELHVGIGVVIGELLVGVAQPVRIGESAPELHRARHVRDVKKRHRRAQPAQEIRAIGEKHEAERQKREVKVTVFPWGASGRAATLGRPEGRTKLIFEPETECSASR